MDNLTIWIGFNVVVLALLALDLGVFQRNAHAVSIREAAIWSGVWIAMSLAFNFFVYQWRGPEAGLQFLTGYLIEKALSVDNIFVFVLVFGFFQVPAKYQHRVLFWGVLGALVMRGLMILVGTALIEQFHWIIYLFGAFLIFTGIRMALSKDEHVDVEANPVVSFVRRHFPITERYEGAKFFVRRAGKTFGTPLLLVVVMVETTDLIFALDSIPAIFAVTRDPFLVYTSNVCAILGLRALYFLLAGVMDRFYYLKVGLAVVLAFVGVKMVLSDVYHLPIELSLGMIAAILTVSIVASLVFPPKAAEAMRVEHNLLEKRPQDRTVASES